MEEVVPVCDRFLTLGRFSHTQLMIALVTSLIRNDLHSVREGKKNKVETLGFAENQCFLPPLAYLLYLADCPSRGPASATDPFLSHPFRMIVALFLLL